jgi:hypothetical protein
MHEIVTLQFGEQANYLGTHFWNCQESYFTYSEDEEALVNHDIHFRVGVSTFSVVHPVVEMSLPPHLLTREMAYDHVY